MHRSSRPLIAPFEFRLQFLRVSSFHGRAISRDKGWNSQMKGMRGGTKRWNGDSKKLFPPFSLSLSPSRSGELTKESRNTKKRREELSSALWKSTRVHKCAPYSSFFFRGLSPLGGTFLAVHIRPGIVCIGRPYQPISGNEIAAAD